MTHSTANGRNIRRVCWFPCLPNPLGHRTGPDGSHAHNRFAISEEHKAQDSAPFVASRKQASSPASPEKQAATVVGVTYFCYRNYSVSRMNVA